MKQYIQHLFGYAHLERITLMLALLALAPDVVLAGFYDEVAAGFARSRATPEQLTMFTVYGSAIFILLVLLNLVRERKGAGRLVALLAIQLLCNAVLIFFLYA